MDLSLFEVFDDPVVVINKNTLEVVFSNSRAKQVFKGLGSRCHSVIYGTEEPCDTAQGLPCPLKRYIEGSAQSNFTIHVVEREGRYRVFLIKSYKLSEELFVEVFMDASKIQGDIGLISNLQYLRLFEKGPVVVFVWENAPGWPVSYVSKNVQELLGYTAEDFTSGRISYSDLIHPEDVDRVAHEVEVYSEGGVPYWEHEHYRVRTKYGVYIWVYDYTVPVRDAEGNITSYIGYILDVSEKHYEWELFRTLAEAAPIGIFLRCDFKLVYANKKLAEITGYSVEELLRFQDISDIVYEKDKPRFQEIIKQRLQGKTGLLTYELRIRTKKGSLRWVSVSSNLINYKGKKCSIGSVMNISEKKRYERKLERLSTRDPLTGAYNRRAVEEFIKEELEKAVSEGSEFGLIIIDIDNFKDINDTYGHIVGDNALKHVAGVIGATVRRSDIFGRWGGDEFIILLPTSDIDRVKQIANRVQRAISHNKLNDNIELHVSVGASTYRRGDSMESLLRRADTALYRAKELGKNRVEIA